eukprot:6092408-Pyramimonas_sp.AAC.1
MSSTLEQQQQFKGYYGCQLYGYEKDRVKRFETCNERQVIVHGSFCTVSPSMCACRGYPCANDACLFAGLSTQRVYPIINTCKSSTSSKMILRCVPPACVLGFWSATPLASPPAISSACLHYSLPFFVITQDLKDLG